MHAAKQGLSGTLEYNADLFDTAAIVQWEGQFQALLKRVVADPGQRLSELNIQRR
jgi:hypothetical protein